MHKPSEEELKHLFGFRAFRKGQKEIIAKILAGHDVLAVLPTGTGKTLCYQYPSRILKGMTIVVSPLLSLMEDQVHQLKAMGEKGACALNSHVSFRDRERILASLNDRSILFVSPEMLQNREVTASLSRVRTGLFAVDEAHCISQWGHEFRTDYLKLAQVREELGNPPCLALTATATEKVQEDIISHLKLERLSRCVHSVDRPNISLHIKKAGTYEEKELTLVQTVNQLKGPGIVYTATRAEADLLAVKLRHRCGLRAASYHGGMEKEDRLLVQQQFVRDETDVVCCTNAFGMGINKPNIRFVVHYHIPQSPEHYVQETGRAGRGGGQACAVLVYQEEDRHLPLSMIVSDLPTDDEIDLLYSVLKTVRPGAGPPTADEAVKSCVSSESKERLLCFYLDQEGLIGEDGRIIMTNAGSSKQRLKNRFQKRKKEKESQFFSMESMVKDHESCTRELLLNYFGEAKTVSPVPCCSSCGDSPFSFQMVKTSASEGTGEAGTSWESLLSRIFHQDIGQKRTGHH
ncbi:RecQ family ATP-dependent DNA helicase [Alteribacter natronophilus]|uniref:RecQ family ATP-dependent DNA helicase n=1 Tax=Alteribacter natronophilus TaxID=2583810 RepID=UPI00110D3141|nr:RecQ family ATP-dependent DNA helicase [Alteribacter natronophilus]TMW73635.1 ATP-dependent DNA helicase RecQ [Alteribacter natronophilus]